MAEEIKKPLSTKQLLQEKVAQRLELPVKTVEAIVAHQFQRVVEAMSTKNSIDICGFGRLLFNDRKAAAIIRQLEGEIALYEQGIQPVKDNGIPFEKKKSECEVIKKRLEYAQFQANSGGLEKRRHKG